MPAAMPLDTPSVPMDAAEEMKTNRRRDIRVLLAIVSDRFRDAAGLTACGYVFNLETACLLAVSHISLDL